MVPHSQGSYSPLVQLPLRAPTGAGDLPCPRRTARAAGHRTRGPGQTRAHPLGVRAGAECPVGLRRPRHNTSILPRARRQVAGAGYRGMNVSSPRRLLRHCRLQPGLGGTQVTDLRTVTARGRAVLLTVQAHRTLMAARLDSRSDREPRGCPRRGLPPKSGELYRMLAKPHYCLKRGSTYRNPAAPSTNPTNVSTPCW